MTSLKKNCKKNLKKIFNLYFFILKIRNLAKQYNHIKKNNFAVKFLHEGSKIVQLPKISFLESIFFKKNLTERSYKYSNRPFKEVLLRKIIFDLYESGYIDNKLAIIDIGCWISDNSIIWSQYLKEEGILFAIDPSPENISYGKILAKLNNIKNIRFVEAVCAEMPGLKLDYDGKFDHARFKPSNSENYILSSSIDKIVNEEKHKIGFIHIDVEGYEFNVLKGAETIVERDKPVITFEQHISKEKVSKVLRYLEDLGYKTFMINEVIPGCSLDCRNFLSIPSFREKPELTDFDQSAGRNFGIFSAVLGNSLIKV